MIIRWSIAFALPVVFAALLQTPPKGEPTPKDELLYPTFEVSLSSRMFKVLAGDLEKVDLAELAKMVTGLDSANTAGKAAGASVSGVDRSGHPSAELLPKLPEAERPFYSLLPIVMMKLAPLWDAKSWTDEQVALATQGSQLIGKVTGAPPVEFKKGSDASNRANLEKLVRWFHATAAKPECLAAMIFTMDDGPYVGFPYEAAAPFPTTLTETLDEHAELRLSKIEREGESWVMQCVRDGKPIWSRVISGLPDGSVADVGFAKTAPAKLGTHGWHVYFWVDWPMGKEQAHMYLGPDCNLLFYYLSW